MARDNHGAVVFAHTAPASHQRIVFLNVGIGMKRDGGHVVKGLVHGLVVQGFNIAEGMSELVSWNANLPGGKTVKHESVIGVRTVGDGDLFASSFAGTLSRGIRRK